MAHRVTFYISAKLEGTGATLGATETLELVTDTFSELGEILCRFHELAERIRNEQAGLENAGTGREVRT